MQCKPIGLLKQMEPSFKLVGAGSRAFSVEEIITTPEKSESRSKVYRRNVNEMRAMTVDKNGEDIS